jgi:hypothetical protein
VAILALHESLPPYASNIVGPLILDLCAALAWVAARIFNRGSIKLQPVMVAVSAWIALLIFTGAYGNSDAIRPPLPI